MVENKEVCAQIHIIRARAAQIVRCDLGLLGVRAASAHCFTVSVAVLLVTLPYELATITSNVDPSSPFATGGVT